MPEQKHFLFWVPFKFFFDFDSKAIILQSRCVKTAFFSICDTGLTHRDTEDLL